MTNKALQDFNKKIHPHLKPSKNGSVIIICEQEEKSVVKKICFHFKNYDDVVMIQQKRSGKKECLGIKNLLQHKPTLESCDFIALICKNKVLKIYFCEIKSINSKEHREKAIKQIKNSRIFFEYLVKSYKECCEIENCEIDKGESYNLYIYPSTVSSKMPTHFSKENNLKFKKIHINDEGIANIENAYNFFDIY